MTEICLTAAELPAVMALPSDHPRRRHLETCPHCRALRHAFAEFLDPSGGDDPELDDADARLGARVQAALDERAHDRQAEDWSRFFTPRGALLAAAAVVVFCAGILAVREAVLRHDARLPEGFGLVRGPVADSTGTRWLQTAAGWRLTWDSAQNGIPVLQVLDGDLRELARRPFDSDNMTNLVLGALPAGAAYLRLLFVDAGDTVARSALIAAQPANP